MIQADEIDRFLAAVFQAAHANLPSGMVFAAEGQAFNADDLRTTISIRIDVCERDPFVLDAPDEPTTVVLPG